MADLAAFTKWVGRAEPVDAPPALADSGAQRLADRVVFGVTYLIGAMVCVIALPEGHGFSGLAPVAVVLLAVSMRFEVQLKVGWIGCQQAAFVFVVFMLPLNFVPLVAMACLVARTSGALDPVGDTLAAASTSWYALAAPLVLATMAPGPASWHQWKAYIVAFGCQFVVSELIMLMRCAMAGKMISFAEEFTVLIVDCSLTPIGIAAAVSERSAPAASIAIVIGTTAMLALTDHEHNLRRAESARALRDPLTGLANRELFLEVSTSCESRCRRSGEHGAVLVLDLDDFKVINDTLGHQAGDEVLVLFAENLRAGLRAADLAARIGGDEFAVILAEPIDATAAQEITDSLRQRLIRPLTLSDGHTVQINVSMGLAMLGPDASTQKALATADAALYTEKFSRNPR